MKVQEQDAFSSQDLRFKVINGFYMNMRSKFTAPGTSIYYYEVGYDFN